MNLQIVLNTPKNLYLNQAIAKKILVKFFFQKKTLNGKYQTPKKPSIISVT